MRRANLADQIHVADVNPQFERCRCHEGAQPSGFESRLRVEAQLFREAAVVRGDGILAQPIAQVTGQPLGHPSRVHEDERRAMPLDECREPIVIFIPDLVRHHRLERRSRNFDAEIHGPDVAGVDDRAGIARRADEIARDLFNRFLCRGEANPLDRPLTHVAQPLE